MKYLKPELYPIFDDLQSINKWENAFVLFEKEFAHIKRKFPCEFVVEMLDGHAFHDSCIRQFLVESMIEKTDLRIVLEDGYEPCVQHKIILFDIDKIRMEQIFGTDWLYCEVLPQKKNRFSLEVSFTGDASFYVEYKNLEYERIIISDN